MFSIEEGSINTSTSSACPESPSSSSPAYPFDGPRFMSHLSTSLLGHTLLHAHDIPSTQEFMRRHGTKLGDGVAMVADRQSSGKGVDQIPIGTCFVCLSTLIPLRAGRGGNTWTSPDGCLMFSAAMLLKVPGAQAPFINYVVSLAVVQGIHDAVGEAVPVGVG